MSKINVKGGTPIGSASLCHTCSWAHIMEGYRESELLVVCSDVSPNIVVPFTVYKCSQYNDKNRPSWDQMEKLALDVVRPISFAKAVGFAVSKDECEDDELVAAD